jgi:hypothetical protein
MWRWSEELASNRCAAPRLHVFATLLFQIVARSSAEALASCSGRHTRAQHTRTLLCAASQQGRSRTGRPSLLFHR